LEFPKRVYTKDEVKRAKELIDKGHRHRLKIKGNKDLNRKLGKPLNLLKQLATMISLKLTLEA